MTRKKKETPVTETVEEVITDIEPVVDNLIDESIEAEIPVEIKKPVEEVKLTGKSVQELQIAVRKLL